MPKKRNSQNHLNIVASLFQGCNIHKYGINEAANVTPNYKITSLPTHSSRMLLKQYFFKGVQISAHLSKLPYPNETATEIH